MPKELTPEQKEEKKLREQKELERLLREQQKPKGLSYFAYFILIIAVVYMVDEITTQISSQMQTVVAHELFAPLYGEDVAVARLGLVGYFTMFMQIVAYFYKTLSDRYGRKIFLILNTVGMGLGMLLIGLSTGIPVYILGSCFIAFFIPHDMQAVYIQECAPKEKRGRLYSVIKCLATLSLMLVPVLRRVFLTDTDWTRWRGVYIVPALIAFAIAVLAAFLVRESDAFLESRIRQLQMTEEEKQSEEARRNAENAQGGLFKGLGYAMKFKQTRWLFIAIAIMTFGMCITSYYENIMYYGYAHEHLAQGMELTAAKQLVTSSVTQALLLFSVGSALLQLIPGFIADRFGRKASAVCMSALCLVSFGLFYYGAYHGFLPYLLGFLAGAAVGSYWAAGDMMDLMVSESAPTNMRVSVATSRSVISGVLYIVAGGITAALANILGDQKIGTVCLLLAVPGMILALTVLCLLVRETRGTDMTKVKFTDYDT